MRTRLTNWAGNVEFGASRVHRPESLEQLRRLVAGSRRIRAIGSGHSFSTVADTDGELVSLERMPRRVTVGPAAGTVRVAAGMTYAQLVTELQATGYALSSMASLPHISVAGTVATGTHGSGDGQRSLAASVAGLQLVGADGEVVELRRDADGDRFLGSVVALGALGVVTEVELDVEPAYRMTQRVLVDVPLAELPGELDTVLGAAYSVSVFTNWHARVAHVYLKDRVGRPGSGWSAGRPAEGPVHPVPGMPGDFCTGQLGVPGWWYERLPHFRAEFVPSSGNELQSEYFVARAAADAAMRALVEVGDVVSPALHVAEIRSVRGDDLWLSPAYRRDSVAFHFTWRNLPAEVTPAMAAVERALSPFDVRPHWAKLTLLEPAEVVGRYERAPDFAELVRVSDPRGTFGNAYLDRLFPRRPARTTH